jgi:hypothetical protein
MRNGTTGTITAIQRGDSPDTDIVQLETVGGVIDCPRAVFDRPRGGLELCYAVTSYAVQGSTREISTSVATATTTRRELYVDITRGRHDNKVYATTVAPPDDTAEHLPTIPRPLVDDLELGLRKQTPPPVAVVDPDALDVVRTRQGRPLAALLAAERAGQPGVHATIERVAATIRQHGHHHPSPPLSVLVGPLPESPHLAHRYRTLGGDLAVLHAAANPPRRRPGDLYERALGVCPADPFVAVEWQRLADDARRLAVDIALHSLRDTPDARRRAPWLIDYLDRCAVAGRLANLDIAAVTELICDVSAWRSTYGVDAGDRRPLGEHPPVGADRAQFDSLAAQLNTSQREQMRGIGIPL